MPQTFRRNFSSKALFDLRPHVDLLALVQMEASKRHNDFYPKILASWEKYGNTQASQRPLVEYVGVYEGLAN